MNKSGLVAILAGTLIFTPVAANAEDAPTNPLLQEPSVPGSVFTTPPQYGDAGNGFVVELPRFNQDGSAYRHGVDPLPIVPNPRSLAELGLDSSTPLLTLADDTIVPLARPMPSIYADKDVWPFGYDSMGQPIPAPKFNPDGTEYIHGVSPLPYEPKSLPEYLPLPPRFTAADFKKLTADQISNMQSGDFAQLPAEVLRTITENQAMLLRGPQIATLTPADAASFNPEAIAAIAPSALRSIPYKSFASLKPEAIDALTVEHLDALSAKHFASLKSSQVAKFDADQVDGFDPADIKALAPAVVSKLKPTLLAKMTDRQLEAFKAAQIKKITKTQKKALTSKQLKVLAD